MVKKLVVSLAWLAPLVLASVAAVAAPPAQKTPAAKPPGVGATHASRQAGAQPKARSRERIYTVTPDMLEPKPQPGKTAGESVPITRKSDVPFVGFEPTGNSLLGVGLWRVPKVERHDPNRGQPLRDQRGKTGRAAAVGFQMSF